MDTMKHERHSPLRLLCFTSQRGDKRKQSFFFAIFHILDARGHNSTKAT